MTRASALRLAALGLGLAVLAERAVTLAGSPPTDFDDAYMFVRYANNLLAGHGLAWNPGEPPVHGATSLLHVLVVAALRGLAPGLDDARLLLAASGGAAVLLLGAVGLAVARFAGRPLLAPVAMAALGASDAFVFHAQSGMDTQLAALAVAGVAAAALWLAEAPGTARALVAALAAELAVLARPDAALYALLVPALAAPRRRALRPFAAALAILGAADLAARRLLLGTALPLGFFVKRPGAYGDFGGEHFWNPYLFLEVFLVAVAPFALVLPLATTRRTARAVAALVGPVVPTFAVLAGLNQIMGHLGRFYFPAAPLLALGAAIALARRLEEPLAPRALAVRAAAAALAIGLGHLALDAAATRYAAGAREPAPPPVTWRLPAREPLPELDSWRASERVAALLRDAPPGTRVALTEHGLVGARAPRAVLIDVIGLHDRRFALGGFELAELWRRAPDLIWLPHPDYGRMLRDLYASDALWAGYRVYPEAFTFGLAVRRDAPALLDLVRAHFAGAYPGRSLDEHEALR